MHLGTTIGDRCDSINKKKAVDDLYLSTNSMMSKFSFCSTDVRCTLFNSFCTSFYGSVLWNLQDIDAIETAWKKCIKKIWKLNTLTRSKYVNCLMKSPFQEMLFIRFINFFSNCYNSDNDITSHVAKQCILGSSSIKRNVLYCAQLISMPPSYVADNVCLIKDELHEFFQADNETLTLVEVLKEICLVREGTSAWD